jgi:hypothetical protein
MARYMAGGDYAFRAVVTTVTEYADGREPRTFTEYFGPYKGLGPARAQITRKQSRAAEWARIRQVRAERTGVPVPYTETVTGYPEVSAITWTRVAD